MPSILCWCGVFFASTLFGLVTMAEAAVVRRVVAVASGSQTQVVVEVDGPFRYRSHGGPDRDSVLVDLEEAQLDENATRVLPIGDSRIDGVVVLHDPKSGVVRLAVDLVSGTAPLLDVAIENSRLILTFRDAKHGSGSVMSDVRTEPELSGAVRTSRPTVAAPTPRRAEPPAPPRRSVLERAVVILDPGHGGKDPGAKAWTGEYEKDIVLDLTTRVARRLRASGEVDVVMTRSTDQYVTLADRRSASQLWAADAFVSIHANASHNDAARGIETYYHPRSTSVSRKSGSSDRAVRRLARQENEGRDVPATGVVGAGVSRASSGRSPAPVLNRRTESAQLARLVQRELVRQLGMRYEAVRDLGAKEGPFFVIKENAAPSVLVEAAFLTHREEGLRMRSEVYREQIADGVARGILAFLEQQQRNGAL